MRKIFLGMAVLLLMETFAMAQGGEVFQDFSETGPAPILREQVGAKAQGMGGAFVAIADDPYAFYWNPAGLIQMKNRMFSTVRISRFEDVDFSSYAATLPFSTSGTLGFGWTELSAGNIPNFSCWDPAFCSSPDPTCSDANDDVPGNGSDDGCFKGIFESKETVYAGGYSFPLKENLSAGITIKSYKRTLFTSTASGTGVDVGLLYKMVPKDPGVDMFSVGLLIQDIMQTKIKWKNTPSNPTETVKANFKIGAAGKFINEKLTLALDFDQTTDFHVGGEFLFNPFIAARTGFDDGDFSAGAALLLAQYQVDYSYIKRDIGDDEQRVGISFLF